MKRETKINRIKEKIRNSKNMFFGIDVSLLNLTPQEKKQLVEEGFRFSNVRTEAYKPYKKGRVDGHRASVLYYSFNQRRKDFKDKVLSGR